MAQRDGTRRISEVTRRNIFDQLSLGKHSWSGRMQDDDFLARIYDLKNMHSTDGRFSDAAGDIWQHRVRNFDWDSDWIFTDGRFDLLHCTDEEFLRFICETVHPVVQPDADAVAMLLTIYNSELINDGFQITETTQISGRPIFAAREVIAAQPALEAAKGIGLLFTADYLNQQITRMEAAIHSDPALAIGTAKELVETCCKTILRARAQPINEALDLPRLVRMTLEHLRLVPGQLPRATEASDSIRKTLGNLAQVANGAAELRNLFGTGHGKNADHPAPSPRLARLAVGAASTLVVFLFETHHADDESGDKSAASIR